MSTSKLTNYLRTYRRRAGLSQRELAFLLGVSVRGPVSEMEKRRRMPLLRTALALEAIFGIPAGDLFAGLRETITSDIEERVDQLAAQLGSKVGTNKRRDYHTARKLAWLEARRRSFAIHEPQQRHAASSRA